ncbi:uncharacterized protein GGS25DRAFT_34624 [Hypoxylon fragiforme]|uniref:uncharacterized protein n=1 Tax=Hypoxylon fragiforme TaxID=63214 RepID=UPI0020C710FA|nr:uncharacterized protein GGS25DRAFT_34624 [Hypoxylon fragiforme]KAI2614118.1 hypothetical protein GGS25DRAFT_34624 [Hypoxylon fragiforme]
MADPRMQAGQPGTSYFMESPAVFPEATRPKKGRGRFSSSTWFKSPRDITWTIDSKLDGRDKPSGYDSNSLITILRSSQCVCAAATLIFYVFTMSAPAPWLLFFAVAMGVLSGGWSILALYLRHQYAIWLVIAEIVLAIGWIVLFATSSAATPEDAKAVTFHLGLLAMEASMVLWIQTCLLAVTPFFHKILPSVFLGKMKIKKKKATSDLEMVR